MADLGICTMCEDEPATTTWGLPVCQPCADWLTGLQGDLAEMEDADPEVKAAGDDLRRVFQALHAVGAPIENDGTAK